MMIPVIFMAIVGLMSVHAEPPVYPQIRFQPLQNVLVLPPSEQLKALPNNSTKQQDTKAKDAKPEEEARAVTMEELRRVEGSVVGSYHVLLENGRLQKVDYTAAPRLPPKEEVRQEPEIRSWYYTQLSPDVLQRYYSQYYGQQQNADYTRPNSANQASNSNSQGFSQSATHGTNQISNNNVQVFHQGKKGAFSGRYDSAASHQNFQRSEIPNQASGHNFQTSRTLNIATSNQNSAGLRSSASSSQNTFSSQQRIRPGNEVETFEPVQRRNEERNQQEFPQNNVVATIYYSDVNPITGPVYSFDQTPLIRVLRQA